MVLIVLDTQAMVRFLPYPDVETWLRHQSDAELLRMFKVAFPITQSREIPAELSATALALFCKERGAIIPVHPLQLLQIAKWFAWFVLVEAGRRLGYIVIKEGRLSFNSIGGKGQPDIALTDLCPRQIRDIINRCAQKLQTV